MFQSHEPKTLPELRWLIFYVRGSDYIYIHVYIIYVYILNILYICNDTDSNYVIILPIIGIPVSFLNPMGINVGIFINLHLL